MRLSAVAMVLQTALVVRVFGPDTVRCCRRLLAAGVRVGIAGMTGAARHPAAAPDDFHLEVEQ
ncbi:hypothetical protein [Streptomyces sp. NBC_00162]|uniref:hypothetical protein n=2 Tax=unclassified Streptomyces TaxID=2593676 RepID=UPI00214BEA41|nr:hypothetical protein [Streptomyces sp. NBC_00162]UUU37494.1 hypothetical protein JIW86_00220 [Streptomyces sp. NBC_00162]